MPNFAFLYLLLLHFQAPSLCCFIFLLSALDFYAINPLVIVVVSVVVLIALIYFLVFGTAGDYNRPQL